MDGYYRCEDKGIEGTGGYWSSRGVRAGLATSGTASELRLGGLRALVRERPEFAVVLCLLERQHSRSGGLLVHQAMQRAAALWSRTQVTVARLNRSTAGCNTGGGCSREQAGGCGGPRRLQVGGAEGGL